MSVKPRINKALDGLNTRTFKEIEIEGKKAYALFDTGSFRSYITNYELGIFLRSNSEAFFGKAFFRKVCLQICAIDGLEFDREALPVEEIGLDERDKRIDAIIGTLGMARTNSRPENRLGRPDCTS